MALMLEHLSWLVVQVEEEAAEEEAMGVPEC